MTGLLDIQDLTITLPSGACAPVPVLEGLNLTIAPGEMLGLVGESGSGKSLAALSIMRLLPARARLSGQIRLAGQDLITASETHMRHVRGQQIGMVFQNPLAALNPTRTVAAQIMEAWRVHERGTAQAARDKALALLEEVGIPSPAARLDDYPHQFSGGMRQRVMLAMALACAPRLLIADEPTTGLDPLTARQILALIARLRRAHGMGVLFITHDLSLLEEHADSIHGLYAGRTVERAPAARFFARPRHPYSAALRDSVPRLGQAELRGIPGTLPEPGTRPPGCYFAPRCTRAQPACTASYPPAVREADSIVHCLFPLEARNIPAPKAPARAPRAFTPHLILRDVSVRHGAVPVLDNITLTLGQGECLGIVGESGAGKTTLAHAILQMLPYAGEILLNGTSFTGLRGAAHRAMRRRLQFVFQDPRESLNPRLRVGTLIAEPLYFTPGLSRAAQRARVADLLADVGLSPDLASRFPGTLSGGQAQRVALARALAGEPEIIVLDEPASSLDVSTQALILNLLQAIASRRPVSYILISHDLALVGCMADRVAVLRQGQIVELAETARLLAAPQHNYTRALIAAAPRAR